MSRSVSSPSVSNGNDSVHRSSKHEHAVQFYESDEYLIKTVGEYLARGFHNGNAMVVIATPEHREGLKKYFQNQGFDVQAALRNGQLTELDARNTLDILMDGEQPN